MKPAVKDNRFLIVTGLSGSGKTVFSRSLEDFGYYCIDNLPAKLIANFIDLWLKKKVEIDRVALVIDIREPRFLADFPSVFRDIRKKTPVRLIFLDATDEALAKRYNETRRPHPLTPRRPILEGVRLERKRLAGIKKMADEVICLFGFDNTVVDNRLSGRSYQPDNFSAESDCSRFQRVVAECPARFGLLESRAVAG